MMIRALVLCLPLVALACNDVEEASAPSTAPVEEAVAEPSSEKRQGPPSVVFVVIDTLRADAVSVYGHIAGTTPKIDRLAQEGLRYERAYAPSSWTIPSHASLFSGLRADEHGIGVYGTAPAGPEFESIAEVLRDAGYETAGFAENMVLGSGIGLDQGFDTYEYLNQDIVVEALQEDKDPVERFDLLHRVKKWQETRDPSRPFFLFVNIFDPHDYYKVRETNPFLPDGVGTKEAWATMYRYQTVRRSICDNLPLAKDIEIFRGLYLGDVAAADRKLDRLLGLLEGPESGRDLITIVTSDHGEHFGEHELMQHRFSVRNPLLEVPLVVHGLPEIPPAVIGGATNQLDLHSSMLCWTLGQNCDRALQTEAGAVEGPVEPIFSTFSPDGMPRRGTGLDERADASRTGDDAEMEARRSCKPRHRVTGRMASLIQYPLKMVWFSDYDPQLYDLSWDPGERSDQLAIAPEFGASLQAEMKRFLESSNFKGRTEDASTEIDPETAEALRALGYAD